jgi:hypothetical protein
LFGLWRGLIQQIAQARGLAFPVGGVDTIEAHAKINAERQFTIGLEERDQADGLFRRCEVRGKLLAESPDNLR